MTTTIKDLAEVCGAEIVGGNPQQTIHSAANIDAAGAHQIAFIAGAKYASKLASIPASAVIVPKDTPAAIAHPDTCLLRVDDPEMAFVACLHHLYPEKVRRAALSPQAVVDPTATLGEGVSVGPFASVGARSTIGKNCRIQAGCHIGEDVTLGDHCVLYPNVVLYDGARLGDNVIIHSGSVIGADGFGYRFRIGDYVKFPQVGNVVIESNVEIGVNSSVDRAALGTTRVGEGTKIDNLVQVGHNCDVGARVLLCSQSGVGGSSVVKDLAVLAAQAGVADHITIGTQAIVLAQAGVTKDVADRDQVIGFPAANRKEALREMAALHRLADNQKDIAELVRLLPKLRDMAAGE
jgi:UDP-3-O-[3-hydroxymyristoyl] glucosamine N-acyltransferase